MKRFAIDWFEFSVSAPLSETFNIIDICNVILNDGLELEETGSSRFYDQSLASRGLVMQYGLKQGLKNNPLNIRLSGKYFQRIDSEERLDDLLQYFRDSGVETKVSRVDACIDFISGRFGTGFEGCPIPIPRNRNFTIKCIEGDEGIETYFSGKSDFCLKVYDKLKENPDYIEDYGYIDDITEVWRVEGLLRGELIKSVVGKQNPETYQDWLRAVYGQIGRRFVFENVILPVSDVTTKRKQTQLVNRVEYARQKLAKAQAAYEALENERLGCLI